MIILDVDDHFDDDKSFTSASAAPVVMIVTHHSGNHRCFTITVSVS